MSFRRILLFFVGLNLLSCGLLADIVYLKGGRKIEGTVLASNAESVVVEMAMGSVTFSRSKIDRIERTPEGNQRRNALQKASEFEGDIDDLMRSITSLYSMKGRLSSSNVRVQNLEKETRRIEERLVKQQQELAGSVEAMEPYAIYDGQRVPSRIYDQYMIVKGKYDTAVAKVQTLESELSNSRKKLAEARNVSGTHQSQLAERVSNLHDLRLKLIRKGCPESALEKTDRMLSGFDDVGFAKQIPLRREGNSFFINVRLNDQVTEEFILDTGCSTIALTPEVANRLNIQPDMVLGRSKATIADGTKIDVQNVYLNSVEVSGMRAERVFAQITISESNAQTPLLLGMSFLERFRFSVDAQSGVLVLE